MSEQCRFFADRQGKDSGFCRGTWPPCFAAAGFPATAGGEKIAAELDLRGNEGAIIGLV